MLVELADVAKGRRGRALPETTTRFRSGEATLAVAETEQRPTVLGLVASGRMRPDAGTVTIDGAADNKALRRRVALLDAPDVSDPAPDVSVLGVVSEELMFAGRRSDPFGALAWLDEHAMRSLSRVPFGQVAPDDRLRLLLELAVLRPGIEGLVLVSPDRHGGSPQAWWTLAEEFAARGFAVLVIAGDAAAAALRAPASAVSSPAALAAPARPGRPRPSRVRPRAVVATRPGHAARPAASATGHPAARPTAHATATAPEGSAR